MERGLLGTSEVQADRMRPLIRHRTYVEIGGSEHIVYVAGGDPLAITSRVRNAAAAIDQSRSAEGEEQGVGAGAHSTRRAVMGDTRVACLAGR